MKRWKFCYTDLPPASQLYPALIEDGIFGADQTSRWHRSRGMKRMLLTDPRWHWFQYYELLPVGFATDDPDIAARFEAICTTLLP